MERLKQSLLIVIALAALSVCVSAQVQTTALSGTVIDQTGQGRAGMKLYVVRTLKDGALVASPQTIATSTTGGAISLTVLRGSTVYLYSTDIPYFAARGNVGMPFAIPDQPTAALENLALLSSVMQAQGDIVAAGANGRPTRIPGNTTTTRKFLMQVGASGVAGPPVWTELAAGAGIGITYSGGRLTITNTGGGGGGGGWGTISGTLSDQTDLQAALDGKQPIDSDLTAIAALSPVNDDILQRKAGAWTNRTPAQFRSDLGLATVATTGAYNDLTGKPTLGTAAALNVPASGDAASGEVVKGNDSRLTNARTPTAHNQAWSTITSTPTTLSGYGITDAAASGHTHTFASLTSKPTTLSGYGITDAAALIHTHAESDVTNLVSDLAAKAPLVSPSFTTPTLGAATATSLAVGIGGVTPPTTFVVGDTSSTTPRGLMSWQSSDDTASAHLHMRKSRGTFASPVSVNSADVLGRVVFGGYDGSGYIESAYIRASAVGTVAGTRIPSKLEFFTSTDVAPSVATLALTLDKDQSATFAGNVTAPGFSGSGANLTGITNAGISNSAAIAYSKLALSGSVVNADVSASAAIAYSKLNLTGAILSTDLAANVVTDAKLRQGGALSVIGRASNSTGNVADITAANDGEVLRRNGTSLGFGTIATAGVANSAITYAKIQDVSATQRVLGRNSAGAGVAEEVSASGVLDWLGSTRGSILYRGAGGWATLAPGTSGQVLQSGGAGADPSWAAAGGGSSPPFTDTQPVVKGSADATKLLRFEVDGFTTGTTRAVTPPDADIVMAGSAVALTSGRVPLVTTGGLLTDSSLFTWQTGASPNLTITAQNAAYKALVVNSAASPSAVPFEVQINGTTGFVVATTGAPSSPIPSVTNSERFGAGQTTTATAANGSNTTLIGNGISVTGTGNWNNTVAVGQGITLNASGGKNADNVVAIGATISIGPNNDAFRSTAVGSAISMDASRSVAVGNGAVVNFNSSYGTAINGGVSSSSSVAINGSVPTSTANTFVAGGAAQGAINNVFFGLGITNSSPTAYTINGTGGSGANVAGADVNLAGGRGTGTARSGAVKLQRAISSASSSTLNSLVDGYVVAGRKNVSTNNTALSLFEIALPTLTGASGKVTYTIYASDGTDVQVRSGVVRFSAVNKAAAYTSETAIVNEAASVSAGTLTATWNVLTGTNKVTLQITPNTSLTATTYYVVFTVENNSEQAVTIL